MPIDDSAVENALRPVAVGRKNHSHLESGRGGRTAAVLYTLTGTCKHHDFDPFAYLQDILHRLPAHPGRSARGTAT